MSSIRHTDKGIGHGPDRADSGMMLRPRFCDRASVRPGIGRLRGRARTKAAAAAMALVMGLAACGTGGAASMGNPNKADLVFWGWDAGNGMKGLIADFRRDNPDIAVKFSNTGTASDTQIALSNAIAAGNGAPDIIMLEAPNITQFAMTGGLVDLSSMGAASYADDFAAGPWNKVQVDGKPYALPIDSGPAMLFYNKAIFDKAGVDGTAIETWDDYYEAARKIRAVGSYITNQSGTEYQSFTAAAWQAGVMPWRIDGESITIDMTENPGMRRYIDFQQKLIDEDLIDTRIANWSDDWNRSLNDGSLASLVIGAWMPVNLMNGAPDQAGNWRVAQLPQWEKGRKDSAENGGSALAVVAQSKQQAAAYKFIDYLTHGKGADTMAATGTFPSLKRILESRSFTDPQSAANRKVNDFFGGQNVNEALSEAAHRTVSDFQWLPYNPFAQSAFNDQISKGYTKEIPLEQAFANYGKALAEYGEQQGYTVTVKD